MELASFVALWLTAIILGFTSAELAEVLSGLWYNISVQFHLNPPQFLPCQTKSVTSSVKQENDADSGDNNVRAKPKKDA